MSTDNAVVAYLADCPRVRAAQEASWRRWGNDRPYMRMLDAFGIAVRLERENAELRRQLALLRSSAPARAAA